MNQSEQEVLFDDYLAKETIAKELHYSRNNYNTNLPNSIFDAEDLGWITKIASYHQNKALDKRNPNVKYISPD
jgi:hypothetical protein